MKSSLLNKAGTILEVICSLDHPVSIKELTTLLDMPLPTISRLCGDLLEIGLLEKTDYHHVIPGMSLVRLGFRAQEHSPLLKVLKKTVDDYADMSGLNAVVYGFENDTFFQIYHRCRNNSTPDPLRYTGAFLILLAAAGKNASDAHDLVLCRYPDMPVTEQVICDREFDIARQSKTLTRIAPNRRWSVSMPFMYNGTVCSLSFYGIGKEERTVETELFEISKVLSRIRTNLDRIGKGEEDTE